MSVRPFPLSRAAVAIPACNEAQAIGTCLAALVTQRLDNGSPLPFGTLAVLVFANNCSDDTADVAKAFAALSPFAIRVVEERLPPERSHAGMARRRAMDLAATWLEDGGMSHGVIMTTDADSAVGSTWAARTLDLIGRGVDAVAGYIEAKPEELVGLGAAFLDRGRLEDRYLSQMAEIFALCDPLPHDPWPTHRVASGASLAVTLAAYRAIGGLPSRPVGEDVALVETLLDRGFRVRHAPDVTVATSCRFDGRARGGAADTMRARHEEPDAPCDDEVEPARRVLRRALWKGALRRWVETDRSGAAAWDRRLHLKPGTVTQWAADLAPFEAVWRKIEATSPRLMRSAPLRPSELPTQIDIAQTLVTRLRAEGSARDKRPWSEGRSAPIGLLDTQLPIVLDQTGLLRTGEA